MIDGEATVKTFKRTGDQVWLMPHNPAFDPIPGNEAAILGRVVTVIRKIQPVARGSGALSSYGPVQKPGGSADFGGSGRCSGRHRAGCAPGTETHVAICPRGMVDNPAGYGCVRTRPDSARQSGKSVTPRHGNC